jgi:hypothetical protein
MEQSLIQGMQVCRCGQPLTWDSVAVKSVQWQQRDATIFYNAALVSQINLARLLVASGSLVLQQTIHLDGNLSLENLDLHVIPLPDPAIAT